jgi:hypothetical protein
MRLTKSELTQIIMEELTELTEGRPKNTGQQDLDTQRMQDRRDIARRRRQNALGGPSMVRLMHGIQEEEGDGECFHIGMNPHHSKKDGKFVDPDKESGSWSAPSYMTKKCEPGQYERPYGRKPKANAEPCGRRSNKRCHDQAIVEEADDQTDWHYEYHSLKKKFDSAIANLDKAKRRMHKTTGGCAFKTAKEALMFVSSVIDATKGSLTRDQGKKN